MKNKILWLVSVLVILLFLVSCVPQQVSDEELEAELAKLTPEQKEALVNDLENENGALAGQAIAAKYGATIAKIPAARVKDAITKAPDQVLKLCNDKKDNDNDGLIDYPFDPGCVSLSDGSESDSLERDKAYAYAWGQASISNSLNNIVIMAFFYDHKPPQNYVSDFYESTSLRNKIKSLTDAQPEGHHVIQIDGIDTWRIPGPNDFVLYPNGSVNGFVDKNGKFKPYLGMFWESSTKEVSDDMAHFFTEYKKVGGKVDWIVQDYEYHYQDIGRLMLIADSYYNLADVTIMGWKNKQDAEYAYFKALEEDPRFQKEHKPFFDKYGYSWIDDCLLTTKTVECENRWSIYIKPKVDYYLTQSFYTPISKIFPDVKNSNFNTGYFNPNYCFPDMAGNTNGYFFCFEGQKGSHVGTHQNPYTYGRLGYAIANKKLDGKNNYLLTPFNAFRYDVNKLRLNVLSSEVPIIPSVMLRSSSMLYDQHTYIPLYNTPYWEELVLHNLLTGADDLLYMKPGPDNYNKLAKEFYLPEDYSLLAKDDVTLNNVLEEFNKIAGFANRKSLVKDLAGWGDDYVLTGMQSGGRNVYRFTPNNATIFTVVEDANGVNFVSGNIKVFIKDGKIYEPQKKVSPIGYWVVQLVK